MSTEQQQLEAAIAALQGQRPLLGAELVEAALGPLKARLASLQAAQARKQVTVLFLDVVGSTTLSRQLDPEDVYAIMDDALGHFTRIVQQHHGQVLNYAGDSVLAVFGVDEVREDDPERAVLAGLALCEAGRKLGVQVQSRYGHAGFGVRVGVHTGAVLLGAGIDSELGVRGVAVNIAARMEQTAPPGALRISHDTYTHVRGVFDVAPQPLLEVHGLDQPLQTYLVLARKPRAFRVLTRGIEGVETRMIGRDAELAELQEVFCSLYQRPALSVTTVVAEAGLGKSRLLYEFENWAEARAEAFYFFQGRGHPLTPSQPYGLLREIMAWRLQIADSDSMEIARQKVEAGVMPLFEVDEATDMAQAHAHLLGHLIGLDFAASPHVAGILQDGKQIRNRGFHACAQVFRRVAAQNAAPVLLVLDDLQYADEGSLDFLNYLCLVNRDVPMMVLTLTRPTLTEWPADWPCGVPTRRMVLQPLDKTHSRMLADELLKKMASIPVALRELVTGGADGNPFYMEELIKMLVDVGAIVTGATHWSVNPERLIAVHVPPTLTGVLQARLDSILPAEKLALQLASVVGLVFWDASLAAMDEQAAQALPGLIRHELIHPHAQSMLDDGLSALREYAFAHQILHQVTYDTILKSTRRKYHAQAAHWLCAQEGVRSRDFLGATAEHFLKAGERDLACEYFTRAAEHAAERYAHEAASAHVAKALPLCEPARDAPAQMTDPQAVLRRWRLLDVRERTLDLQGRRSEQWAAMEALQQIALTLADVHKLGNVAQRRSSLAMRTGDYTLMLSAAQEAMALAEQVDDPLLLLRGQQRVALARTYLGDAQGGQTLALSGLEQARALGAREIEARFLNALSVIAEFQTDQIASLELDQQDLLINRELGNRRNEAIALANLGSGWLKLGARTLAREHLEQGLRLARSVGDRATQPHILSNLSVLARYQGDDALALAHAQSALEIAIDVHSPEFEAIAWCALGNAELALGRFAAAQQAFERSLGVAARHENATQLDAQAGLVRTALAQGDLAAALHCALAVLDHLDQNASLDGTEAPFLIRLSCYQALHAAGDPRNVEVLQRAQKALQQIADTLPDADLRERFLREVPEHRALLDAHP